MTTLAALSQATLNQPVDPVVRALAERLAREVGAIAALFYGSNLRTGAQDGVLDFYLLMEGARERGLWPRVSYHEVETGAGMLRAKVATMTLATFRAAAEARTADTTIWARFVQPAALAWANDTESALAVRGAVSAAACSAARFAAALGPGRGTALDFWRALFRATYAAEFRVERGSRADQIVEHDPARWCALLPAAWTAAGIAFDSEDQALAPKLDAAQRTALRAKWRRRQRLGKPLNLLRLVRAASTFAGAARYAAWKIERHTGIAVTLTPWQERHPVLAAPGVLWRVWRARP